MSRAAGAACVGSMHCQSVHSGQQAQAALKPSELVKNPKPRPFSYCCASCVQSTICLASCNFDRAWYLLQVPAGE